MFFELTLLLVLSYFVLLQCWENCELLQSNYQVWGAVCDEKDICVSIHSLKHYKAKFDKIMTTYRLESRIKYLKE